MSIFPCHQTTIHSIEQICEQRGITLTPLRHQILSILIQKQTGQTAYEILDQLKLKRPNAKAMTVYRVLNFLEEHHLIHKLAGKNTYSLCQHPGKAHLPQLITCTSCHNTVEVIAPKLQRAIKNLLDEHQFTLSSRPIEIYGDCQGCQTV